MYRQRCVLLIFSAMLFFACLTGCIFSSDLAAPAASISETPAWYETEPLAWLKQRVTEFSPDPSQMLSSEEIDRLNELGYLTIGTEPFLHSSEKEKSAITFSLYIYYQELRIYDKKKGSYVIREGLAYPPDKVEVIDGETYAQTSANKANAFIRDVYGVDIPEFTSDCGEWEESAVVSRGGKYYIKQGDYISMAYSLRAYQYLGDGVFYLSFDADDRNLPGGGENRIGHVPDYCRMLVVRSDSAWGFTVLAEPKGGNNSLLPADFPLPLYAA